MQVAAHRDRVLELEHVGLVAQQRRHTTHQVRGQVGRYTTLALEVLLQHDEVGQAGALVDQLVALQGEHGRGDHVLHDAVHLDGVLLVVGGGHGGGGGRGHSGREGRAGKG